MRCGATSRVLCQEDSPLEGGIPDEGVKPILSWRKTRLMLNVHAAFCSRTWTTLIFSTRARAASSFGRWR